MSATVIAIIAEHLRANGFGGLVNAGECGCELGDLQPCGESFAGCKPGYKHSYPNHPDGGDWVISTDKNWSPDHES